MSSTVVCAVVATIIIAVAIIIIVKNENKADVKVHPTDTYEVDETWDDTMGDTKEHVVFGAPCVNYQYSKKHSLTIEMTSRPATASDIILDRPPSSTPRDMAPVE